MKNKKATLRYCVGLWALAALFAIPFSASAEVTQAGNSNILNTALPERGNGYLAGIADSGITKSGNTMNIVQTAEAAVIEWDKGFNVGANATVNFSRSSGGSFATLNYDSSGALSQIYGDINAENGSIYIVNPSGVTIGDGAQINAGSLYVSNQKIDDITNFKADINMSSLGGKDFGAGELMSLGNINAEKITFVGGRVVLDVDNMTTDGQAENYAEVRVKSNDLDNVVIGANTPDTRITGEGAKITVLDEKGSSQNLSNYAYQWISRLNGSNSLMNLAQEDDESDEAYQARMAKNYALRYSINAIATKDDEAGEDVAKPTKYVPIGTEAAPFTGKFDGVGNSIFGLQIKTVKSGDASGAKADDNVGLFGVAGDGAIIRNLDLVDGVITGRNNVGALIGKAVGNVTVSGITSSINVVGLKNVGGILGAGVAGDDGKGAHLTDVINVSEVDGHENVGGLVGSMENGTLDGTSYYNLGTIKGFGLEENPNIKDGNEDDVVTEDETDAKAAVRLLYTMKADESGTATAGEEYSHSVGGLVGYAKKSSVTGSEEIEIYNNGHVYGGYDVGGIVGRMEGGTVSHVYNEGKVMAEGYAEETYTFHTDAEFNADKDGNYKNNDATNTYSTNGTRMVTNVRMANAGGIAGNASGGAKIFFVENLADVQSAEIEAIAETGTAPAAFTHYGAGNVGGIAGKAVDTDIEDATNKESKIYGAMNVGGIAGYFGIISEGKENDAEYGVVAYSIKDSVNSGGEILATGGIRTSSSGAEAFVKELVRHYSTADEYKSTSSPENFIVGNMGGIAGYMEGENCSIDSCGNRGNIHSMDISDAGSIPETAKVANAGGIVGKIDKADGSGLSLAGRLSYVKANQESASVYGSYNTGHVTGYTGVGGIAGMSYNGSIAASYNVGDIATTRTLEGASAANGAALNMGGIVGDTTEAASGRTVLYDVHNEGTVGDSDFTYAGRHVGGIAGRFSGAMEKAYNTGDIYNASLATGGLVGYWYNGSIKDVYNVGNITVDYSDPKGDRSGTGGLVGIVEVSGGNGNDNETDSEGTKKSYYGIKKTLSYAYNLGTIRGVRRSGSKGALAVGGLIGQTVAYGNGKGYDKSSALKKVDIDNVYVTGNIYRATGEDEESKKENKAYAFVGLNDTATIKLANAYYILPADYKEKEYLHITGDNSKKWSVLQHGVTSLSKVSIINAADNTVTNAEDWTSIPAASGSAAGTSAASYGNFDLYVQDISDGKFYKYGENGKASEATATSDEDFQSGWRIVDGSTMPMLNVFLPYAEEWFSKEEDGTSNWDTIKSTTGKNSTIQYGTAYDPLLTIITSGNGGDVTIGSGADFGGSGKLAVYNGGLILDGVSLTNSAGMYTGLLYSDKTLTLNTNGGDFSVGRSGELYGSDIVINTGDGALQVFGTVQATGNDIEDDEAGNVTITAGSVASYGTIATAKSGAKYLIPGISTYGSPVNYPANDAEESPYENFTRDELGYTGGDASLVSKSPLNLAAMHGHETENASRGGDLKITTEASVTENGNVREDGSVSLLYGNMEVGETKVYGDLTIDAEGDVYIDTDLTAEGNITIESGMEAVLDISNIGMTQLPTAEKNQGKVNANAVKEFFNTYNTKEGGEKSISLTAGESAFIAVDLWNPYGTAGNRDSTDGTGAYDLFRFATESNEDIRNYIENCRVTAVSYKGSTGEKEASDGAAALYVWIDSAEQLADLEAYIDETQETYPTFTTLTTNLALKSDIDGTDISNYKPIAADADETYTGTFNGRDHSITNLNSNQGGLFGTIGKGGVVENIRIYDSTVTKDNWTNSNTSLGLIAGDNIGGTIRNIYAFGNRIEGTGETGGIVGNNQKGGLVQAVTSENVVLNKDVSTGHIGGIAGVNFGTVEDAESISAITSTVTMTDAQEPQNYEGGVTGGEDDDKILYSMASMGGIVGRNAGTISDVSSYGVINGLYTIDEEQRLFRTASNVGGIVGVNAGIVKEAFNDAVVSGLKNVGGVAGWNRNTGTEESNQIKNVVNAAYVYGGENVGGIAGLNDGVLKDSRNNADVRSGKMAPGKVVAGKAVQEDGTSILMDNTGKEVKLLESVAYVYGTNVGGLVGLSSETSQMSDLVNDKSAAVRGEQNVGGLIGKNEGYVTQGSNLMNYGEILGYKNVGGAIGLNAEKGQVVNISSSYSANIKVDTSGETDMAPKDAGGNTNYKNFGGIIGENAGFAANLSSRANVAGADNVGGVIGENSGTIAGLIANGGTVSGEAKSYEDDNGGTVTVGGQGIGGVIGLNSAAINSEAELEEGKTISSAYGTTTLINGAAVKQGQDGMPQFAVTETGEQDYELSGTSVTGGEGSGAVGGLIGKNSANIENTDLINTVEGTVTSKGPGAVGGLIGENSGTVTGGRDSGDSYYKYQVYNNGTVSGVNDVGGLVGVNDGKGSLSLAYNTGSVSGKENVGGIAGRNEGKVSEVFSAIMVRSVDETSGAYTWSGGSVSGTANVGGLIGNNSGTLKDAYSTSAASAETNAGNAVGMNNGTVSNVYSTIATEGTTLIGASGEKASVSNSYSYVSGDTSATDVISSDARMESGSYRGFGFTGDGAAWKIYEGYTAPMLKNFLTTAAVTLDEGADTTFTYNGSKQGYVVEPAKDDDGTWKKNGDGYYYAIIYKTTDGGATKTRVGTITAGSAAAVHSMADYLTSYSGADDGTNLLNGVREANAGTRLGIYSAQIKDMTAASSSALSLAEPNYLGYDLDVGVVSYTTDKRKISVTLDDITRTYGGPDFKSSNGKTSYSDAYTWEFAGSDLTDAQKAALEKEIEGKLSIAETRDGAVDLADGETKREGQVTNDANYTAEGSHKISESSADYQWRADVTLNDESGNYEIETSSLSAASKVKQKDLVLNADDAETAKGSLPGFTGTDAAAQLVNGDAAAFRYGLADEGLVSEVGAHHGVIGLWVDGGFYKLDGSDTFGGFFRNYKISQRPGTLTVTDAGGPEEPEVPDDPWIPGNPWDYLLRDAPWGDMRNFRERKAEINFIAGGMTV